MEEYLYNRFNETAVIFEDKEKFIAVCDGLRREFDSYSKAVNFCYRHGYRF